MAKEIAGSLGGRGRSVGSVGRLGRGSLELCMQGGQRVGACVMPWLAVLWPLPKGLEVRRGAGVSLWNRDAEPALTCARFSRGNVATFFGPLSGVFPPPPGHRCRFLGLALPWWCTSAAVRRGAQCGANMFGVRGQDERDKRKQTSFFLEIQRQRLAGKVQPG